MALNFLARIRRTSFIIVLCLAILASLVLARRATFNASSIPIMLMPAAYVFRKHKALFRTILLISLFLLGWWRGSIYISYSKQIQALKGRQVELLGTAQNDAVYGDKTQITFDIANIALANNPQQKLRGTFKISGFGEPMVYKGDQVLVSGKLYLTRGSRQAAISFAKISRLQAASSPVDLQRRRFMAGVQTAIPDPEASLGIGLLIGQRSTLPSDTLAVLTTVGLVHIVAVSGYNVTIISRSIQKLKITRSKYQQLVLSIIFIGLFITVTGFSASVVRAALVAYLSLWAWYYGRQFRPLLLIMFVAAVTAFWNPYYLWSDIGWYLSFLAFFGVLIVAPIITANIFKIKSPRLLGGVLVETLCAQAMTLPLILVIFGRLSVISTLANILVVPLVPLAMLLTLLGGIAGMFVPGFAGWIAWPAEKLLTYMIDISGTLAKAPGASAKIYLNWPEMFTCYLIVIAFIQLLNMRLKQIKNVIISQRN